jgi:hypothetical protein
MRGEIWHLLLLLLLVLLLVLLLPLDSGSF